MSTKSKVLITGGAGYIGSHVAKQFLENGYQVVVLDNFIASNPKVLDRLRKYGDFEFYEVDLTDANGVKAALEKENDIDAVLHFAALTSVSGSTENPSLYIKNNVVGSFNLLEAVKEKGIDKFVFSSTCAVYKEPQYVPVDEKHPIGPLNPYGDTKLMMEKILKWFAETYNINYVVFRYFNVAGSSPDAYLGYDKQPSEHLIPNVVKGALGLADFELTYPEVDTPDGSPIRDYINVNDLADAHFKAYEYLAKGGASDSINLGSGKGFSVEEIIKKVEELTGKEIEEQEGEKRSGEFAKIYADYSRARDILKWEPTSSLEKTIQECISWHETNPNGY